MFLGSSESPGELASEFQTVHERCKVFRKWRQARLPADIRLAAPATLGATLGAQSSPAAAIRGFSVLRRKTDAGLLSVYDHLLSRYMPASLLVDENRELVDSFGGAEKLLRLPSRRPSLDILELVDAGLRTTLMGAMQRVLKTESHVRFAGVKISSDSGEQLYNLTVEPFRNPSTKTLQYLFTFEPVGAFRPLSSEAFDAAIDSSEVSDAHMKQLEEDLRYTQENLQATIEELETSNEELQATTKSLLRRTKNYRAPTKNCIRSMRSCTRSMRSISGRLMSWLRSITICTTCSRTPMLPPSSRQ